MRSEVGGRPTAITVRTARGVFSVFYRCEDGWHIFRCSDLPGLYVASRDYAKALADVRPSIELLQRLDAKASAA